MRAKETQLEIKHCEEALNQELIIGSSHDRKKMFTFHVWSNEYKVWKNGVVIESGQALEELLECYNSL